MIRVKPIPLDLPFELLPLNGGQLADALVVSYAPSVTVLGDLIQRAAGARASQPGRLFLGIGLTAADGGQPADLLPLPGTREVSDIAADYGPGAKAVSGAAAAKEQ